MRAEPTVSAAPLGSPRERSGPRLEALHTTLLGAAAWIAAPLLSPLGFGTIEHFFLSVPLVVAPLALRLGARLLGDVPPAYRLARRVQPFAAALVFASFLLPVGRAAAGLAGAWAAMALLALFGARHLRVAHLFLVVGAGWLLLSRLGVGPRGLAPVTVLLAALHFHFSGFVVQLLAASGARAADGPVRAVHRAVGVAAVLGIVLLAAGKLGAAPGVRFAGVAVMVMSLLGLAGATARLGLALGGAPRVLLLTSAASLAGGMVLAGAYGIGELRGEAWIGLPTMAATHGVLQAFGFALGGVAGHLARRG